MSEIGRLRALANQRELAGHPELDPHHPVGRLLGIAVVVQRKQKVLSAPADGPDVTAPKSSLKRAAGDPTQDQVVMVDSDAFDPPPEERCGEIAANRLDLREFGHASPLQQPSRCR